MKRERDGIFGSVFIGSIFILIGLAWILNNMNIVNLRDFVWWPLILIWIGLIHMIDRKSTSTFSAWFFVLLGLFFLLTSNDILDWELTSKFWPIILIIFGIRIISSKKTAPAHKESHSDRTNSFTGMAFFSGFNRRLNSKAFRWGRVTALFGGAEIDLRDSELSKDGAKMELTAIFGGIDLKIPKDWNIVLNSNAVFGGIGNKSLNPVDPEGKNLMITANVIFGGIEIKIRWKNPFS